ncbi:MAG: hypothetical protein DRP70_05050 [Spirochaetes bacterium]|nr:MAG: hypothetical protein DRP70_05050 [Spirochaetota bacterium]
MSPGLDLKFQFHSPEVFRMGESVIYNVRDFGAAGDGITPDTHAVQITIDTCSKNGGGVVFFPSGSCFLIGTIYLKSHICMHVAENAVILGSTDLTDYGKDTGFCPYYPEPLDPCLIHAEGEKGITFTGRGIIDSQFQEDFQCKHDDPLAHDSIQRPMLIRLNDCSDISMENLTLRGAHSWCVHIKYCRDVKLRGLTVLNDRQDGFNIESSCRITISDCTLFCGDDGIALTTSHRDKPLADLSITNCIISSRWAAFRIGPLSKGSFERIVMSNCVLKDCGGGGIKIGMFEGAEVKNCIFSSIVMENVTAPILIMNAQWTDIGSQVSEPRMMPAGKISNIQFSNLIIEAHAGPTIPWDKKSYSHDDIHDFLVRPDRNSTIFLHGHKDGVLKHISLQNICLTLPGGGEAVPSPLENIVDMHEIDIGEHGYWTDDKTVWGIPVSSAVFGRHLENLRIRDMDISYQTPEGRPIFAFADCTTVILRDSWEDGRKISGGDIIQQNCGDSLKVD